MTYQHLIQLEPCPKGLLELSCVCGWTSSGKFASVANAEKIWVMHVNGEIL